jgi:transcriptional regulator with XRE-family HTH domain
MEYRLMEQIDLKKLGSRLQDARRSAGLTQEDAAKALGMARTTIVAIEKGERRVSPHELIEFAKSYRRAVSDLVGRPVISESFVPQFRAVRGRTESDIEIDPIAAELQSLSEDYVALERIRSMPLSQNYPNEYDTSGGSPEQVAEDVATAERNRLGMGDGPIGNLRERLASDVGIRIFFSKMPSRIAGLFAYNEILGACIGINSKHPRDRRNVCIRATPFFRWLLICVEVES